MSGAVPLGRDDGGLEKGGGRGGVATSGDQGAAGSPVLDEQALGHGRYGGNGPSGPERPPLGDGTVAEGLELDERDLGLELRDGDGPCSLVAAPHGVAVARRIATQRIAGRPRARLEAWRRHCHDNEVLEWVRDGYKMSFVCADADVPSYVARRNGDGCIEHD